MYVHLYVCCLPAFTTYHSTLILEVLSTVLEMIKTVVSPDSSETKSKYFSFALQLLVIEVQI